MKFPKSIKDIKNPGQLDPLAKFNKTIIDPLGLGIGDAVYGKNKGPDYSQYDAEQQAQIDAQQKAYEEFILGGAPEYKVGEELQYEDLDPNQLAKLGPSGMGNIKTDQRYTDNELEALRMLEEQSKDGYSARDQADLARIEQNASRANRGRQDAIRMEMENRGLGGSGLDFVMRQQAAQDAAEREALEGLEKNAQMQERKQAAALRLGGLSSELQGRDFEQQAAKAQAQDAIDRFNTANSVNQQQANWQQGNSAVQANWNRGNQVSDNNVDAKYGFRKDKLSAKTKQAQNAFDWSVDKQNTKMIQDQQEEEATAGKFGAVLGAAGGVVGGIYGGPQGAAAGTAVGQGVGQGVGRTGHRNKSFAAFGGRVDGFEDLEDPLNAYNDDAINTDSFGNDRIPVNLSPKEVVLPASVAKSPEKAKKFVQNLPKGPEGSIQARNQPENLSKDELAELAKKNPQLVDVYREKFGDADQAIVDAQSRQDMGSFANVAGKALNDYNNSQKRDVVLKNKMQNLGDGPSMMKADRPEYDGSAIDKLGQQGVDRARQAKADVQANYTRDQVLRMEDPNSEESIQAREYLKRIVPDSGNLQGFDRLSAARIEKLAPGLYQAYNAGEDRKSRAEDRAESRATRYALAQQSRQEKADAKAEKNAEKMEQLKIGDLGFARTSEDAKDLKNAVETKASFDSKLDELIALRQDKGVEYLDREAVARGKQLSKELLLDYKNLAKLGVLSQSDEEIINAIIPTDPLGQDLAPGQDPILSGLQKWKGDIARDYETKLKNRLRGGGPANSPAASGGKLIHGSDLPD